MSDDTSQDLSHSTYVGRDANGRFNSAHTGRPPGSRNKRTETGQALIDQYHYDPRQAALVFCRDLQLRLLANNFASDYERIEYTKIYNSALATALPYFYPKLKAVEHAGELEIVAKLRALDTCTDEELRALLVEAEEMARRPHP
jgi:hypothetical protein